MMIGLCVAGALAAASAQPPGTMTMSQAVAQFGTPTYDRNCEDGTITLAWKQSEDRESAQVQPGVVRVRGRSAVGSQGVVGQKSTRVMKFDAEGRLVWARQVH